MLATGAATTNRNKSTEVESGRSKQAAVFEQPRRRWKNRRRVRGLDAGGVQASQRWWAGGGGGVAGGGGGDVGRKNTRALTLACLRCSVQAASPRLRREKEKKKHIVEL